MTAISITEETFASNFGVPRETIDRLKVYVELLKKWNPKINLVAKSTMDNVWHRHIADSAQLWALAPSGAKSWVDIGSGAGFPGLVIAAIAAEKAPELTVTLVESDRRKAIFLQTVTRAMNVSVQVVTKRIESLEPQNADILSARALASLSQLLEYADKHRKPSGICLFPKGARAELELTEAATCWHISHTTNASVTDPDAVILSIGEFQRA